MNTKLAYLAGFFDGEGCIVVGINGSLQMRVINTSKEVLDIFQEVLGGSIKKRKQRVNKAQYYWGCYGHSALDVISQLSPFSIEKLPQFEVAISYIKEIQSINNHNRINHIRSNPFERQVIIDNVRVKLTELKLKESSD